MDKWNFQVATFVALTSQLAMSFSRRLKTIVRGTFHTIDVALGIGILVILLPPILVAMQIHRIKQWSEDYNEEL
jgi:hypothetical protein